MPPSTLRFLLIAFVPLTLLAACRSSSTTDLPEAGPRYDGPAARLSLEHDDPVTTILASVRVPTGGWSFEIDEAAVEGRTAMIHATLEQPGPDEIVTQALQMKQAGWSTDQPFKIAELHIRQRLRGGGQEGGDWRFAASVVRGGSPRLEQPEQISPN